MASQAKLAQEAERLDDSAVQIKDSAAKTERSTARIEGSADRRTELAADRTVFAAERTYAAWVRTGLVAIGSGVGARALLAGILPQWLILLTGGVLILLARFVSTRRCGAISIMPIRRSPAPSVCILHCLLS